MVEQSAVNRCVVSSSLTGAAIHKREKMNRYEFNITVAGNGESVDEAFANVLDSLKEDPAAAIINEVVYVIANNDNQEESDNATEDN
jgi:hypothetical protein